MTTWATKTSMAAAAVCALWAGSAGATIYNLDLTAIVGDGAYQTSSSGGFRFDSWSTNVNGLAPFTVTEGDEFNLNVTLDQLFTVPTADAHTSWVLFLSGDGFPTDDTATYGSFEFFNGLTSVASGSSGSPPTMTDPAQAGTTTSGGIAHSVVFFSPNNPQITFDSIQTHFTVLGLPQSGEVQFAVLAYTRVSALGAVPEPATWAVMLLGFGGIGAMLRRRRGLALA